MGKKYKVKKDYGSGQRSSYYGFRKDFPEGGRKGRFRKSASRSERGKRIAKIALMVLGFAAVMVLAFFITDFALNLSNKPAVTKPPQVETGSGGQGSAAGAAVRGACSAAAKSNCGALAAGEDASQCICPR